MLIGAVADIHGNFDALQRAIERHPDVPLWICVGDLASRSGEYPEPPTPLYWIKGNNENFDRIAAWQAGGPGPRNLHYIPNGTAARPFIIVDEPKPGRKPIRRDAGKPVVNDLLATMKPRLHLCGHHHRFIETVREGVRSVCIDRINRSYLLIDPDTMEYRKINQ